MASYFLEFSFEFLKLEPRAGSPQTPCSGLTAFRLRRAPQSCQLRGFGVRLLRPPSDGHAAAQHLPASLALQTSLRSRGHLVRARPAKDPLQRFALHPLAVWGAWSVAEGEHPCVVLQVLQRAVLSRLGSAWRGDKNFVCIFQRSRLPVLKLYFSIPLGFENHPVH